MAGMLRRIWFILSLMFSSPHIPMFFTTALWLAHSFLLPGCATAPAHQSAAANQEDSLRRTSAAWDAMFNARAVAQLAALYAEDAVSMPPAAPSITGRAAIRRDFEALFAANNVRHETRIDQFIIDGDRAIELAHYTLTTQPRPDGDTVVETGRHVVCRRKTPLQWEIIWEIWNTDGPAQK